MPLRAQISTSVYWNSNKANISLFFHVKRSDLPNKVENFTVLLIFKIICWCLSPVIWRLSCEIIDQLYIGSPFLRYFGLAKQSWFFSSSRRLWDRVTYSRLNAPATSREKWFAIATIDARGLQNAMRSVVQRILP